MTPTGAAGRRAASQRFDQLVVFTATPLPGNPLAAVHDADAPAETTMAAFARSTNLLETTFLLRLTLQGGCVGCR